MLCLNFIYIYTLNYLFLNPCFRWCNVAMFCAGDLSALAYQTQLFAQQPSPTQHLDPISASSRSSSYSSVVSNGTDLKHAGQCLLSVSMGFSVFSVSFFATVWWPWLVYVSFSWLHSDRKNLSPLSIDLKAPGTFIGSRGVSSASRHSADVSDSSIRYHPLK